MPGGQPLRWLFLTLVEDEGNVGPKGGDEGRPVLAVPHLVKVVVLEGSPIPVQAQEGEEREDCFGVPEVEGAQVRQGLIFAMEQGC